MFAGKYLVAFGSFEQEDVCSNVHNLLINLETAQVKTWLYMISKLDIRILGIFKLNLFGTSKLNTRANLHTYEFCFYFDNRHFPFLSHLNFSLNVLRNYFTFIRREMKQPKLSDVMIRLWNHGKTKVA